MTSGRTVPSDFGPGGAETMGRSEPSRPRVSVVIPTFNRAAFLPSAVRSALEQTLREIEVIIVDDGSTDATPEVCRSFVAGDSRIRVIRQANRGLAAARNAGVAAARADWIAFLDDDDLWVPEALATMLTATTGDEDAIASLCHRFVSTDPDLVASAILSDPTRFDLASWPPVPPPATIALAGLLLRPLVPIHAALFRRACLVELGGFDPQFHAGEDYDLWLRMAARRPIRVVAAALALVRSHRAQMSASLGSQARATRLVLEGFLASHPEGWTAAGRLRLRRRLALLAREEAYASLLAGNKSVAAAAAWRSITWCVTQPKSWLYLALAPLPGVYVRLRRLRKRIEG